MNKKIIIKIIKMKYQQEEKRLEKIKDIIKKNIFSYNDIPQIERIISKYKYVFFCNKFSAIDECMSISDLKLIINYCDLEESAQIKRIIIKLEMSILECNGKIHLFQNLNVFDMELLISSF